MKVLIAEDERTSRRLLEFLLSSWGHEVISTHDGMEAWRVLQSPDAPYLAVLDWAMPGLTGVEVCRMLRATTSSPAVYVLLVTGRRGKEDIAEGLEAGADDYIVKPFDHEELRARLEVKTIPSPGTWAPSFARGRSRRGARSEHLF
jgi:DNA-binding response OmpR family regulator